MKHGGGIMAQGYTGEQKVFFLIYRGVAGNSFFFVSFFSSHSFLPLTWFTFNRTLFSFLILLAGRVLFHFISSRTKFLPFRWGRRIGGGGGGGVVGVRPLSNEPYTIMST